MKERLYRPSGQDIVRVLSVAAILSTTPGAQPQESQVLLTKYIQETPPETRPLTRNGLTVTDIPEITAQAVSRDIRNKWIHAEREVWEYTGRWYPMSKNTARDQGIPTLYDLGGPLDKYDQIARRLGFVSDARRWDEQFSAAMLKRQLEDDQKFKRDRDGAEWLGNCQGLANAQVLEIQPPTLTTNINGERVTYDDKVGMLIADHTADGVGSYTETREGIKALLDWFKRTKRPIVIELAKPLPNGKLQEGKWFRALDAITIDNKYVRVTDINKGKLIFSVSLIRAAYVPIPNAGANTKAGQLMKHWDNPWIKEQLIDYIVYGKPLN